jgi:DHA1 family bicyclomycin/chloramphenicol resistance-like MFS transporter
LRDAAAVTGFISTIMAVPISIYIGRFIAETALPLFVGFSICAGLSISLFYLLKIDEKRGLLLSKTATNSSHAGVPKRSELT